MVLVTTLWGGGGGDGEGHAGGWTASRSIKSNSFLPFLPMRGWQLRDGK